MRARPWLVAFLLCAAAGPARAQRTLTVEDFAATVTVGSDGAIDVTETIRARFTGSWNGIYRTIPVEYTTPQGFDYELRLDIQAVTDAGGRALTFESSRERHYRKLKIWVPDAADATRTVLIRYRVANGLKFFEDHDELYWNITGDEWEVPIEQAHAFVGLPEAATGIRVAAFTGGYGSQEAAAVSAVRGPTVTVNSTRVLSFREGLTVAVAWDRGAVARPTAARKVGNFLRANGILFVPLFVAAVMGAFWWRVGRDPRRRPIAVQYDAPAGLTPAEVGALTDNTVDLRDITATIVDLAVRGFLRVREDRQERMLGLVTKTDYELVLLRPSADWTGLQPHERALLDALFTTTEAPAAGVGPDGVDRVMISDLRNRFYKELPGISNHVYARLVALGYYRRRPDSVRGRSWFVAALVLVGGLALTGFLSLGLGAVFASIASAAIIGVMGFIMPARTVEGTRAFEGAVGFEEFLSRVEADRLERVVRTPELFERFLPFAMALGVERNWARAFEGIYTQPPAWYVGPHAGAFGPRAFADSLGGLSSTASSAMSSSPRSSGGSGFSGGSSGGGFGGGGGGGF